MCKHTYPNFYNQISKYLINKIKILPADERNEIDRDLQRNNCFINSGETNEFPNRNIIYTFCEFFQQHWRFPGFQDLVVVPKAEVPYFIKASKGISTNQLYEKFISTDYLGLVSIQVLAASNIYNGASTEISRQVLSEFSQNMSNQTLNKDNYNVFMQIDRTA